MQVPLTQNMMETDEIIVMAAFGVVAFAFMYAMIEKCKSTKGDKIEFEVDTEKCPVPVARENKKEIKKTLKNVMAKHNAKASLIA